MSTKKQILSSDISSLLEKMKKVELLTEEEEQVKQQIAIWLKKIKEANKKKQEAKIGKLPARRKLDFSKPPPPKPRFDDSNTE